MKKINIIYILLLLSIILSAFIIYQTYAKYVEQVDTTYEAGIKKWKIKVNGQDIRQSEVFDKTLTVNTVKNEDIKSNMIVPGAKFYVDIEIDYSEVDVPFIVEYNTKNVDEQFTDFKMLRLYNNQR